MAKQKGIIKLEGSIGDISFYKGRDGNFMARTKTGISGDRIKNDPAFVRTRENGQEFGKAGKAGKLVRSAFREIIKNNKDSRMSNRLTQSLLKIIQADTVNVRGERIIQADNISLFKGFEFNNAAPLSTVLILPFTIEIDRTSGSVTANLPAFVPTTSILAPEGSTHAQLVLGCSEVDFDLEKYVTASTQSTAIPLNSVQQAQLTLDCDFTESSSMNLLVVFGIEFLQEVNGQQYPLRNGAYNALSLIDTSIAER